MVVAPADFWALGGFDEGFFLHVDDIDFCLRMRRAGGRVVFLPQVRPVHYRSSSQTNPVAVEWHKARGFMRYFRNNFLVSHGRFLIELTNLAVGLRFVVKAAWLALGSLWRETGPRPVAVKAVTTRVEGNGTQAQPVRGEQDANRRFTTSRPA